MGEPQGKSLGTPDIRYMVPVIRQKLPEAANITICIAFEIAPLFAARIIFALRQPLITMHINVLTRVPTT